MDTDKNNEPISNESDYNYVDMFYTSCEYSGEFWGKLSASIINTTSYYGQIGLNGLKKSHNKYMSNVEPAFNESKEKLVETFKK